MKEFQQFNLFKIMRFSLAFHLNKALSNLAYKLYKLNLNMHTRIIPLFTDIKISILQIVLNNQQIFYSNSLHN